MSETPEEETARLLAPYIVARNAAAHECLQLLLDGRHAASQIALEKYQLTCLATQAAEDICGWFDAGTEGEHIHVE
jgi:hypothetical protein